MDKRCKYEPTTHQEIYSDHPSFCAHPSSFCLCNYKRHRFSSASSLCAKEYCARYGSRGIASWEDCTNLNDYSPTFVFNSSAKRTMVSVAPSSIPDLSIPSRSSSVL